MESPYNPRLSGRIISAIVPPALVSGTLPASPAKRREASKASELVESAQAAEKTVYIMFPP